MRRPLLVAALAAVVLASSGTGRSAAAPAAPAVSSAAPGSPAVPILMYHVISDPPAGAPFPGLYVSPGAFAAQVAWLAGHGFHAVTLDDVYRHWVSGAPLAASPVVLSFDDGYRSDYTKAYRVLRARRWPGVLNLEVRNTTVAWGLSPRRVRRMLAAG